MCFSAGGALGSGVFSGGQRGGWRGGWLLSIAFNRLVAPREGAAVGQRVGVGGGQLLTGDPGVVAGCSRSGAQEVGRHVLGPGHVGLEMVF